MGAPEQPPIGSWVKDCRGRASVRVVDSDGRDGWAPSPHGFYACGKWEAMWEAWGPLELCGPYGRPVVDPLVWLMDYMLVHWIESLPVVLETLEEASAPEPVLALVRERLAAQQATSL